MNEVPGAQTRVFVTGATGFIGRAIVAALLEAGACVVALVRADDDAAARRRLEAAVREALPAGHAVEPGSLDVVAGDLGDATVPPDWRAALDGCDVLVHAAALPKLGRTKWEEVEPLHVGASQRLLIAAGRAGVGRFLHISTAFVGADAAGHLGESAPHPGEGANDYERSKSLGELALLATQSRCELHILRPGIVLPSAIGCAHGASLSPLGDFSAALARARRLGVLPVGPDPLVRPGFVHLGDIVRCVVALCLSSPSAAAARKGASFWNLVATDRPSLGELIGAWNALGGEPRLGTTRAVARVARPVSWWQPYLGRPRTWEMRETTRGLGALRLSLSPVAVEDVVLPLLAASPLLRPGSARSTGSVPSFAA